VRSFISAEGGDGRTTGLNNGTRCTAVMPPAAATATVTAKIREEREIRTRTSSLYKEPGVQEVPCCSATVRRRILSHLTPCFQGDGMSRRPSPTPWSVRSGYNVCGSLCDRQSNGELHRRGQFHLVPGFRQGVDECFRSGDMWERLATTRTSFCSR